MPNLHPFLVHFPIALLASSLVLELIGLVRPSPDFTRAGWWTQLLGSIGLMVAVLSGIFARGEVHLDAAGASLLDTHEELAFFNAGVFSILLLWRIAAKTKVPHANSVWFLILFGAGVAALCAGAWIGGELVYGFGAGVPRTLH